MRAITRRMIIEKFVSDSKLRTARRNLRNKKARNKKVNIFRKALLAEEAKVRLRMIKQLKPCFGKPGFLPKIEKNAFEVMWATFTEGQWMQDFRMSKTAFTFICDLLNDELSPSTSSNSRALSTEKQVAVAIYKLASYCEYRVVARVFGIGKSTVHKCVTNFSRALNKFAVDFINMPNEEEAREISSQFEEICKLPQIIGVIDGTHIPILAPKDGYRDFVNRKHWTSYNVQLVCDAKYRIRDVSCKFPGSVHDAQVFKESGLNKNILEIVPKFKKEVYGKEVPFYILGDPAYALKMFLIKNYVPPKDDNELSFNVYMNTARVRIENTIMRLKARWHILSKRMDLFYKTAPSIILTCCILHNICETIDKTNANLTVMSMPPVTYEQPDPLSLHRGNDIDQAYVLRDHLKEYLVEHFPLHLDTPFRRN